MRFDLPSPDNESQPWWDAAAEGRFLIRHCAACDHRYWYPRDFCPSCWSDQVEWEQSSGRGTVYTYSVVHRNDLPPWPQRVPYVPAVVDLEEGPRVMTTLVNCDLDALRVGMPVQVAFQQDEDDEAPTLPVFEPAG